MGKGRRHPQQRAATHGCTAQSFLHTRSSRYRGPEQPRSHFQQRHSVIRNAILQRRCFVQSMLVTQPMARRAPSGRRSIVVRDGYVGWLMRGKDQLHQRPDTVAKDSCMHDVRRKLRALGTVQHVCGCGWYPQVVNAGGRGTSGASYGHRKWLLHFFSSLTRFGLSQAR
jgi:hypothetical protein